MILLSWGIDSNHPWDMGTRFLFLIALAMGPTSLSFADMTASQSFVVSVPATVDVVTPEETAITAIDDFDASTGERVFAAQIWSVTSNTDAGVAFTCSVAEPFTHQSDPSIKTDAGLSVAVISQSGPASWNVSQSSDQTSHASGDTGAAVQVTSNNHGTAEIGLTVAFVPISPDHVAQGVYSATVVCTIASPE